MDIPSCTTATLAEHTVLMQVETCILTLRHRQTQIAHTLTYTYTHIDTHMCIRHIQSQVRTQAYVPNTVSWVPMDGYYFLWVDGQAYPLSPPPPPTFRAQVRQSLCICLHNVCCLMCTHLCARHLLACCLVTCLHCYLVTFCVF